MQGSNDAAEVRGSFQETAPRKTTEHTVKHRDGGVGSVLANHCSSSESSVAVTTLLLTIHIPSNITYEHTIWPTFWQKEYE